MWQNAEAKRMVTFAVWSDIMLLKALLMCQFLSIEAVGLPSCNEPKCILILNQEGHYLIDVLSFA